MSRPVDWSPLAESDPVPGDPDEVSRLSTRYAKTADAIERQAANLRRLAGGTGASWDSDAGKVFSDHANDLADRIGQAHDRYAAAASVLGRWVGPLQSAQREADAALRDAKEAQSRMDANHPTPQPQPGPSTSPPTPEQQKAEADRKAAEQARARAYEAASGDLAGARRRMNTAVDDYHSAARNLAGALRKVIDHDSVHDSFWDKVGGWIHDHAGTLNTILKVVGYIVTALAIAALVISLFIPGLNVLVLGVALTTILEVAAAVGTAAMLVGHTALALTGDGSWFDVGLDILGLATFGVGKLAGRGAEEAVTVARSAAAERAAVDATAAVENSNRFATRLYGLANRVPVLRDIVGAQANLDRMAAEAVEAGNNARAGIMDLPTAVTTIGSRVRFGGSEWAARLAEVSRLDDLVPDVPEVAAATARLTARATTATAASYGGMVADGAGHVIEDVVPGAKKLVNRYTTAPVIPLP